MKPSPLDADFLRPREFASRLGGVTERTVVRMTDDGRLACVRLNGRGDRLIPTAELDRLRREAETNRARTLGAPSPPADTA